MATILIVEDHADTLHIMLRIMRRFGHHAIGAETGEAGLALLASEKPRLIIVDGMMPGMNGTEFIRLCRANPDTATIPIILNTAVMEEHFIEDAIRKGASEVWMKGNVSMEQMGERVAHYLHCTSD